MLEGEVESVRNMYRCSFDLNPFVAYMQGKGKGFVERIVDLNAV